MATGPVKVKGQHGGPRPGFGGKQPGAGRPKKPPTTVDGLDCTTARTFFEGIMANAKLDIKERMAAAKVIASMDRAPLKPLGKKEQAKVDAAEQTGTGPFTSGKPPSNVAPIKRQA